MESSMLKSIISSMHNGVIVVDVDSKIIFLNASAKKMFQVEGEKWEGKNIREVIPKTRLPDVLSDGMSTIGVKMELAGTQCMVNRTPLYNDNRLIGAISVIQDMSEMEHYRSLLSQMESIIEFSTDGIYVVDHSGVTLLVNAAYREMTGFPSEKLIGRHMSELMNQGYFDQSVSLLVLEKKKRISIIQNIGGEKDVIVTGNPVFNPYGEIEMVVTSVRDITQLNEMKAELEKARGFLNINRNRYAFNIDGSDQKLIFQSEEMNKVFQQVKQVAPYPTSILLSGASGVGKEVIANVIHQLSDRKEHPFIKINCGAIPEHLLESELFGYEKGAFTGASQDGKIGLLELADGGTVMFDEVAEMPLALQVKLLRALQEKQIQRIGGHALRNIDIRIISATNQNLKKLIKEGKFREDLFYRLQVVECHIPSLAERPEDVEVLIDHYFYYFCNQYHIEKQIASKTKEILTHYHWPGNVRELKNVMENMIVSVPATLIEPHHLPAHIYSRSEPTGDLTLKQRVEQFEKGIIKDTLQKNHSLRQAAKQLGIDHSTLVKKLKRWGM